ncbi:MAG: FKBP-type peptidyl-prolyl cis-trans isomerase [Anaerolineae bacterium]|nr:FKBP-type peptidyl-prolyl cis-trans isomerase [Anaerolineae bacterium]
MITSSGLEYIDLQTGTGATPRRGDTVQVHYTGTFPDGRQFDSSRDRGTPFSFRMGMGEVIQGWDEGVALMKVGGKAKLIIPPGLAYGAQGASGVIPPNATLHFEVELLGIE